VIAWLAGDSALPFWSRVHDAGLAICLI
jgi:hypothetical protein